MTKVLIVDDNPAVRQMLQMAFEDEDYLLVEAGTGKEAREVLRVALEPMVVVLDYLLPDLDGGTLLEQLAAQASRRASQRLWSFILCSGLNPVVVAARCAPLRRRLSIQIVAKPFRLDELFAAIRRAALDLEAGENRAPRAPRAPRVRSRRQRHMELAPV